MAHVVHWDDCQARDRRAGDIHATWFDLGKLGGSDRVGLNRITIQPGRRSTPAHIHGAEEEIFHVLSGTGLLWQDGQVCEVGPGDTIAHPANAQTHTLRAGDEVLDVLAFGTRVPLELCYLPRAGHAWAGPTVVEAPGMRNLFKLDDAAGDFPFP
ncbi:MAG TPA: cupin domain-containing protein, partial [Gaiellales bacterium]|nr:cupin domain-containing protein [Gaiellales bacterium]